MSDIEVMIEESSLSLRVHELARDIVDNWPECSDTGEKRIFAVGLLKGAFVFMADMVRALSSAGALVEIEFMTVSSYGSSTESSGKVSLVGPPPPGLDGHHVLLVDDILDTGRSLLFAKKLLQAAGAEEVQTCVLLDKPERRTEAIAADYVGFPIPDRFVVGYGLDHGGRFRELPYIGAVT